MLLVSLLGAPPTTLWASQLLGQAMAHLLVDEHFLDALQQSFRFGQL